MSFPWGLISKSTSWVRGTLLTHTTMSMRSTSYSVDL
jgi:hypothetical protein